MKKYGFNRIVFCVFIIICAADCSGAAQTFFQPRSVSINSTIELASHNYHQYHNNYVEKAYDKPEDWMMFSLQLTQFYQASVDAENLARHFLPGRKTEILVKEDGTGDVGSMWLQLMAGNSELFSSKLTIRPRRYTYGMLWKFHWDLSKIIDGAWFNISLIPMWVHHQLNFKEETVSGAEVNGRTQGGLGIFQDLHLLADALNNRTWLYGRFKQTTMRKSGLDDIPVKVGWHFWKQRDSHAGAYGIVLIPMNDSSSSNNIFEPALGNGNHLGLGLGLNEDYRFLEKGTHSLNVMSDFKYLYLLPGHERRSFDLDNGDWSRYLLVVNPNRVEGQLPNLQAQELAGINFFTRDVTVRPRHQIDWLTALHYQYRKYNFEVGYNLWWRAREHVRLVTDWDEDVENIGIYDLLGATNGSPVSASTADISQSIFSGNQVTSDTTFTNIAECDLNLRSAESPSALSHTLYGSFSVDGTIWHQPLMLGLGGSYEFRGNKGATDQWTVWLKCSISYGGAFKVVEKPSKYNYVPVKRKHDMQ